jgi:hypothetical protein
VGHSGWQVIAIRLFTGPMFMKYNAKLRQFPPAGVQALKGNGYVTTIHAVVSAIIKLSRTWRIPHDRKVDTILKSTFSSDLALAI